MQKIFYEEIIENRKVCNCGTNNLRQIDVSNENKDFIHKICNCGNIYTDDSQLVNACNEQIKQLLALN